MRIFNNPYDETPMKYHYFLVFFLLPLSILYYGNRSYLFWSLFIGFLSDIKLAAGYPELVYRVSIVYSMRFCVCLPI